MIKIACITPYVKLKSKIIGTLKSLNINMIPIKQNAFEYMSSNLGNQTSG